ncbi:hypothetical protein [Acidithiobacillus thiooxidans]|nr:hypothetical protein [Acidithiobacillus thiooxidans]MDX5936563.1 hypothetical protein [Acidithiobacillus thiooxidans]
MNLKNGREIQEQTEEHIDWLENHINLIDKMGLPNFMQTASGPLGGGEE